MSELKIAIISFIILILCTISNSIFVNKEVQSLIISAQSLPDINSEQCKFMINEFEADWKKFKSKASLTSNYAEISKISLLVKELYVHLDNNNEEDFDNVIENLINSLNELSRLEKLSFESIF